LPLGKKASFGFFPARVDSPLAPFSISLCCAFSVPTKIFLPKQLISEILLLIWDSRERGKLTFFVQRVQKI